MTGLGVCCEDSAGVGAGEMPRYVTGAGSASADKVGFATISELAGPAFGKSAVVVPAAKDPGVEIATFRGRPVEPFSIAGADSSEVGRLVALGSLEEIFLVSVAVRLQPAINNPRDSGNRIVFFICAGN